MAYEPYPTYHEDALIKGMERPSGWKSIPLRWFIQTGSGDFISNYDIDNQRSSNTPIPVIGGNGVMAYTSKTNTPKNSMVVGRVGAHCGNVHLIEEPCWVTDNALRVKFSVQELNPRYFYWALRVLSLNDFANKNAQPLITGETIKSKRLHYPSVQEQTKIAEFLDYKTAQIDRLIEKKKALVEMLNEQRIAMITQAVTKGLNPDAPMKDSEVDWLGEMPEHWNIRRLKLLAKEPLKYGANEAASLTDRNLPRYIRITDVKEDGSLHEDTFRSLEDDLAESYLLQEGDILLARSGATVGKSFQYDKSWGQAAYAGYLIRFRTDETLIDAKFAYNFLRSSSYWANINSTLIQSTIQNFSAEKYGNISIPLPPIREQQEIAKFITKKLSKLNKFYDKTNEAILRLEEYRTALITSAVTGKIDVRDTNLTKEIQ